MKILVAGGAGYIGSVLVPLLADRGHETVVSDLMWFGNHLRPETPVRKTDVFDLSESDLEGFDGVVFLAGLSNDPMAEYSPKLNFVFNASAPAYLGYIAKRAGVRRFVFASSCSVYGYAVDHLYEEEASVSPAYPYGISKLQGEQALHQMADPDFSVISLRMGTVCGFSPRMRLDLIVNTMFRTAIQQGRIIVDNPEIWRPVLSIRDAADAYARAVDAEPSLSGIFNIASGNYQVGEVGDLVKATLEDRMDQAVQLETRHRQDIRNYRVDTRKAEHVLGFKPAHDVTAIVEDLIANRDSFRDFDNPDYINISVFKNIYPDLDRT